MCDIWLNNREQSKVLKIIVVAFLRGIRFFIIADDIHEGKLNLQHVQSQLGA
jgi:hypothetical protein